MNMSAFSITLLLALGIASFTVGMTLMESTIQCLVMAVSVILFVQLVIYMYKVTKLN